MRRIIIVLATFLSICTLAFADRQCTLCKGTGRVVSHVTVATFGVPQVKKRCPECGEMHYSDHVHKTCPMCHGSGRISSDKPSGSNLSDYWDAYDADPVMKAWALQTAMTIKYGVPMTDAERKAIKEYYCRNQQGCVDLQHWIDMANAAIINYNHMMAIGAFQYLNPDNVARVWNEYVTNLNEVNSQLQDPGDVLNNLRNRMGKALNDSYNRYYNAVYQDYYWKQRQKQLEDEQLIRWTTL